MTESPAGLINGLFETHLYVADLQKAMQFYGGVLGLELGRKEMDRRVAFYWIGGKRQAMLGLWEKPPWVTGAMQNPVVPQHLAFEVHFEDLKTASDRMKQRGIELRNFFDHIIDEPSVFGWVPAASIYFNDVDGHLLEFIARLEDEPAADVGVISLTEWMRLRGR